MKTRRARFFLNHFSFTFSAQSFFPINGDEILPWILFDGANGVHIYQEERKPEIKLPSGR